MQARLVRCRGTGEVHLDHFGCPDEDQFAGVADGEPAGYWSALAP